MFRPFFYCVLWALNTTICLMLAAKEELNKSFTTFELLELRVTALEKENERLKRRLSNLEEKKVLKP